MVFPQFPDHFHHVVVAAVFNTPASDETALCLMLLLHACVIETTEEGRRATGVAGLAPITAGHAADLVARLFRSGERSHGVRWSSKFFGEWAAYELLADLPDRLEPAVARVRDQLESHPWVDRLVDDDWDVLASLN